MKICKGVHDLLNIIPMIRWPSKFDINYQMTHWMNHQRHVTPTMKYIFNNPLCKENTSHSSTMYMNLTLHLFKTQEYHHDRTTTAPLCSSTEPGHGQEKSDSKRTSRLNSNGSRPWQKYLKTFKLEVQPYAWTALNFHHGRYEVHVQAIGSGLWVRSLG